MREYLFHGKRVDNGEWVEGYYVRRKDVHRIINFELSLNAEGFCVEPGSVGQYTGMNEFVLIDETRNAPLFEGDIVEVWGWRTVRGYNQSQYDKMVKVRGVIYFGYHGWHINYDNNYNRSLAKLKGAETKEREVSGSSMLNYYGCHGGDREKYRAERFEWHGQFHNPENISGHYDIKKIGNMFDNKDLLEG